MKIDFYRSNKHRCRYRYFLLYMHTNDMRDVYRDIQHLTHVNDIIKNINPMAVQYKTQTAQNIYILYHFSFIYI